MAVEPHGVADEVEAGEGGEPDLAAVPAAGPQEHQVCLAAADADGRANQCEKRLAIGDRNRDTAIYGLVLGTWGGEIPQLSGQASFLYNSLRTPPTVWSNLERSKSNSLL